MLNRRGRGGRRGRTANAADEILVRRVLCAVVVISNAMTNYDGTKSTTQEKRTEASGEGFLPPLRPPRPLRFKTLRYFCVRQLRLTASSATRRLLTPASAFRA